MYYSVIRTLDELLGDDGILRLPRYLPKAFVLDKNRSDAIDTAISWIKSGKNVMIEGPPGTGKTALMFIILSKLSKMYRIGYIMDGIGYIGKEHMEKGIILFYDDIPRMNTNILREIDRQKIGSIITTARTEEIASLRRISGIDLYKTFNVIKIEPLSERKIREMLMKYIANEGIKIRDQEAVDVVVQKAEGLPVYVWQVIRELKIKREDLTLEYARTIPSGMLDYVDDILWRILGGKPERYEALLTLLIMTDFTKYAVHQDLYNYIYIVAKEIRLKQKLSLDDIILDQVIEDVSRYLARDKTLYSFRLPHDSWADVLKGKSSGPMSPEISKINARYNKDARTEIIITAAKRAWSEILSKSDDTSRVGAFKKNIRTNLGEHVLGQIIEVSTKRHIEKQEPLYKPEETQKERVKIHIEERPIRETRFEIPKIKIEMAYVSSFCVLLLGVFGSMISSVMLFEIIAGYLGEFYGAIMTILSIYNILYALVGIGFFFFVDVLQKRKNIGYLVAIVFLLISMWNWEIILLETQFIGIVYFFSPMIGILLAIYFKSLKNKFCFLGAVLLVFFRLLIMFLLFFMSPFYSVLLFTFVLAFVGDFGYILLGFGMRSMVKSLNKITT